jgi:hypothetical protein
MKGSFLRYDGTRWRHAAVDFRDTETPVGCERNFYSLLGFGADLFFTGNMGYVLRMSPR